MITEFGIFFSFELEIVRFLGFDSGHLKEICDTIICRFLESSEI